MFAAQVVGLRTAKQRPPALLSTCLGFLTLLSRLALRGAQKG